MLNTWIIGISVTIFAEDRLSRCSLNKKFSGSHILLLKIGMAILDTDRVDSTVAVDKDVIIVERSPGPVRHTAIISSIDFLGDISANDAVVDLRFESTRRFSTFKEGQRREVDLGLCRQVCGVFGEVSHDTGT